MMTTYIKMIILVYNIYCRKCKRLAAHYTDTKCHYCGQEYET